MSRFNAQFVPNSNHELGRWDSLKGLGRLYSLILPCGPVKAVINNFFFPNFRNVNSLLFGYSEGTKRVPPLKMTFRKGEARPVPAFKVGLSTFSAL